MGDPERARRRAVWLMLNVVAQRRLTLSVFEAQYSHRRIRHLLKHCARLPRTREAEIQVVWEKGKYRDN